MSNDKILKVGHSPDPDDAFMFYGLASGKVKLDGITIEHMLEDIQSLNVRAIAGELPVTAISAHAYPYVSDKYWIMRTGASMGEGYGPIIVSKKYTRMEELVGRRVAQPGRLTTANLLLQIYFPDLERVEIPFDKIIDAIERDEVDAGVLIHEGQITWAEQGLNKLADFGTIWEKETGGLPLPLGLDVVRKDLGEALAVKLSNALRDSIAYGYSHQEESIPYALEWGRGISYELGAKFVKMYVSDVTIDMGEAGKKALELLFKKGFEGGLIPKVEEIELY